MTVEYMLWSKKIILTSKCIVPKEIKKTVVVAAGIHVPKQNISSKAAVLNNNQSRRFSFSKSKQGRCIKVTLL